MRKPNTRLNKNITYPAKTLLAFLPFLILLICIIPHTGHAYDTSCWIKWAVNIRENGFSRTYQSGANYLFVYQYILLIFVKIQGTVENIIAHIHQLKIFTLLFELGTTLVLFKILNHYWKDTSKAIQYSLYYFLNIAVLYNSLIWGQMDGIMTFFVFSSLYFAYRKKVFYALVLFFLAINTKFQSIVFLPLVVVLLLPAIREKGFLKKTVLSVVTIILITVLAYAPFILVGDLPLMWKNTFGSTIGHSPFASANAYNIWYLLLNQDPYTVSDSTLFGGLTYRMWGILLFAFFSVFALYHFIKPSIEILFRKKSADFPLNKVIISCALVPLLFFFFNTEMHDRFTHPVLIFLALYAFLYKRPLPYLTVSLAYLLNLDAVFKFFQTGLYDTFIYAPGFISCLYILSMLLLFTDLYDFRIKSRKSAVKVSS